MQIETSADLSTYSLKYSIGKWLIGQPLNLEETLEEACSCMLFISSSSSSSIHSAHVAIAKSAASDVVSY